MYDLIIIGAGPAGLTASVYASRYRINHVVLGFSESSALFQAHLIENWPGQKSISGAELLKLFVDQAQGLGSEIRAENVQQIMKVGESFSVVTNEGTYEAKTIIIASGAHERKLEVPGEEEFLGRGVSYCATCDGAFFRGKTVAVIGGGNSATLAALMLSEHSPQVYLINKNPEFVAEPIRMERVKAEKKITVLTDTNIRAILGDKKVEKIQVERGGKMEELQVDGVFVEIGSVPNSVLFRGLGLTLNEKGAIVVDAGGATNVPGVFAAGDITMGSNGVRQALSAAAEGMLAATGAYQFIKQK